MVEEGISHCFTTAILSARVRLRKLDPAIYHLACRWIEVPEEHSVYVGDNLEPDVEGTHAAGFGGIILVHDPQKGRVEEKRNACDYLIENLGEPPDIFSEHS